LTSEGFEKFSVYGFSIDYPKVCRVEFNPKSRRESGDVVFHFPDKEKLYLSWGELEKAQKSFQTIEKQAEHGVENLRKGGNVKNFERVKQDTLNVNTHKAIYNHIKVGQPVPGLFSSKKITYRQGYSCHLHCENSSRYFVIYTILSPNGPEDFGELTLTIIESFECH
jgi:hypothetical protein